MLNWLKAWMRTSTGAPEPAPEAPRAPETEWGRYWRLARTGLMALAGLAVAGAAGWYLLGQRHGDWAVVVVAGDWHAHDGGKTQAFDNARQDVSAALESIGFKANDLEQFSSDPQDYPVGSVLPADRNSIGVGLLDLAQKATGGCLVYFSSHGGPQGLLVSGQFMTPPVLERILDVDCGDRPTVVILSACYSGTFVPALEGDNRMIITAARADRTSFGCGQDSRYPYFDDCVIQNLRVSHGFPELADKVKDCVANMEAETGVSPPSEPQVYIGSKVAAALPRW
ncbi:MAG TPA: C13 family peptidase [Rhizomicrobium sp.]|nr:C13 family peptidase [Rhizomicrobium sp.]